MGNKRLKKTRRQRFLWIVREPADGFIKTDEFWVYEAKPVRGVGKCYHPKPKTDFDSLLPWEVQALGLDRMKLPGRKPVKVTFEASV